MKFARYTFLAAGIYGILLITPMYFTEAQIAADFPPALTHPEYYYGFVGVTLAWQIAFILISRDPLKFRLLIPVTVVEKYSYGIAILWLYAQQRVPPFAVGFGLVDLLLGTLFIVAFFKTKQANT
jgi:hypothetical protein